MSVVAARPEETGRSNSAVLLTASLVSSLIMLDSNVVAVSLPAISRSLHANFAQVQWVISAYVLTYAALLLAAGNFGDLYGRRKSMLVGLAIFGISSVGCGIATTAETLNLARAAQGVGGAMLLTASLAIISHDFAGVERTRAIAFWGASLGIALAIGPVVGGMMTDFFGWRSVFFVNVPASAALIGATVIVIQESRDPHARKLDFAGIATFSLGLALFIWALIDGNDRGWASQAILARLGGAVLLIAAFVFVELRQERPMVDFGLFRRPTFLGSAFAMLGYGAGAQVMIFFLPLFLQNSYSFAPLTAGMAMIPFAAPMVLAPRLTTRLSMRFSGRALLTAGLAITAIGDALFWLAASEDRAYPIFAATMVIAGTGAGLLNGMTVKVMSGAVPADRAGMASGLASTTRFIGILVAVAVLGTALSRVVRVTFADAAMAVGANTSDSENAARRVEAGDLTGALAVLPESARGPLHSVGLMAFSHGFAVAALIAAFVAAAACVLTFIFVRRADTAPTSVPMSARPCKTIDCRDPL